MVKKWYSRIKYRNMLLFILVLFLVGFLFGIAYYLRLNNGIKESLIPSLIALKDGLAVTKINNILIHLLIEICIVILAFTVIGLPIIYFYLFFEALSIGFSICAIVSVLGFKGLLFTLIYFFIYKVLYLILIIFLIIRSSRIAKNMIGFIIYRNSNELRNNIMINVRKVVVVILLIFILDSLLYSLSPLINKLLIIFL